MGGSRRRKQAVGAYTPSYGRDYALPSIDPRFIDERFTITSGSVEISGRVEFKGNGVGEVRCSNDTLSFDFPSFPYKQKRHSGTASATLANG